MIVFICGFIAFILGIVGLVVWWEPFVVMFKAVLPVMFILGGGIAAYMGSQEVKDKLKAHREAKREPFNAEDKEQAEVLERYRNEVQELKDRLAALESDNKDNDKKDK